MKGYPAWLLSCHLSLCRRISLLLRDLMMAFTQQFELDHITTKIGPGTPVAGIERVCSCSFDRPTKSCNKYWPLTAYDMLPAFTAAARNEAGLKKQAALRMTRGS